MILDLKLVHGIPYGLGKREATLWIFEKYFLRARSLLVFIFFHLKFSVFFSLILKRSNLALFFDLYGSMRVPLGCSVIQSPRKKISSNSRIIIQSGSPVLIGNCPCVKKSYAMSQNSRIYFCVLKHDGQLISTRASVCARARRVIARRFTITDGPL